MAAAKDNCWDGLRAEQLEQQRAANSEQRLVVQLADWMAERMAAMLATKMERRQAVGLVPLLEKWLVDWKAS